MPALDRQLIILALGAALVAPSVFAGDAIPDARQAATTATRADAVSQRTTARESGHMKDAATESGSTTQVSESADAGLRSEPPSALLSRNDWLQLDLNSDGKLGASEVASNGAFSAAFAVMDSNGDGLVTQLEYTAWVKAHR